MTSKNSGTNKFKKSAIEFIGEIRQSQVVSTWGPGAVADLRNASGAPVSVIMAGLDEWGKKGLDHPQAIQEPRLEQDLEVNGFRMPPVGEIKDGLDKRTRWDVLPAVRFPTWLQCQAVSCGRLRRVGTPHPDQFRQALDKKGNEILAFYCKHCTNKKSDGSTQYAWAVPARLIVACPHGHLDEFPWKYWANSKEDSPSCTCEKPDLRIEQRFAGLAGRFVRCAACQPPTGGRSLEGVFGEGALKRIGVTCRGREPWLRGSGDDCPENDSSRVLQRGASNVYWSCIESALSIPPFSGIPADPLAIFDSYASTIRELIQDAQSGDPDANDDLKLQVKMAVRKKQINADDANHAVETYRAATGVSGSGKRDREGRKWEEYLSFQAVKKSPVHDPEFHVVPGLQGDSVPALFRDHIDAILLAYKLREVRAQTSFTRIHPPSGDFSAPNNPRGLLRRFPGTDYKDRWLPAAEIRGEGVFIGFHLDAIEEWEQSSAVQERFADHASQLENMAEGFEPPPNHAARMLMLHSFSHALMRELSLECGYSSAALAERIYAGPVPDHPERKMAGVLIFTGSPDAGGTLGGLVRRGRQQFIIGTLKRVLHEARWCSTDPLCITGASSISVPNNMAACHGCLLVPETSCEYPFFNGFLDRGMLVGTPDCPELGFFNEVIQDLDAELG